MFAIIGILVVLGAVVGGYLMEHGKLLVLMQPAELVIIGGAAAGTLLIANPLSTVIAIMKGMLGVLKEAPTPRSPIWKRSRCCTSCSCWLANRAW